MFKSMKCRLKGHAFVDSRSQPGTRVCVRCQHRTSFEGIANSSRADDRPDGPGAVTPRAG